MALTKPAAGCLQLIGGFFLVVGVGIFFSPHPAGLIPIAIGGLIVWAGGRGVRKRIREERHR